MYLRAQPQANVLDLSQNDNGHYCNSTEEQLVIAQEGSAIGPLLRAVNFVSVAFAFSTSRERPKNLK